MSTGSQHKLFNYELAPPPTVWEKIATDLDDAALEFKFPLKLNEYSIVPPGGVWEKISTQLDESAMIQTYSDKLYHIEVSPPKEAWANIQTALDGPSEEKFSEKKKIFPFLRYAAAAAIIGLLTWGGYQLLNNNSGKKDIAEKVSIISNEKSDFSKMDQSKNEVKERAIADILANTDEARNDAALEASKKTYAKLEISTNKKIKEVANFYFGETALSGATRSININDSSPIITNPDIVDNSSVRYFLLITPDGNIIRMSKKLGNLVCCVSGEEQNEDCKDQLKKWKIKMATTQTGHSTGNFMDILSLLNSLQEEN